MDADLLYVIAFVSLLLASIFAFIAEVLKKDTYKTRITTFIVCFVILSDIVVLLTHGVPKHIAMLSALILFPLSVMLSFALANAIRTPDRLSYKVRIGMDEDEALSIMERKPNEVKTTSMGVVYTWTHNIHRGVFDFTKYKLVGLIEIKCVCQKVESNNEPMHKHERIFEIISNAFDEPDCDF